MTYVVIYERFIWFDRSVRRGRYPNATILADKFEISRKTAQRNIDFMRDRLGAPLDYDAGRRGYHYTDQSFQLTPFQASQEELLAVLTARNLLTHVSGGYLSREIGRLEPRRRPSRRPMCLIGLALSTEVVDNLVPAASFPHKVPQDQGLICPAHKNSKSGQFQ